MILGMKIILELIIKMIILLQPIKIILKDIVLSFKTRFLELVLSIIFLYFPKNGRKNLV